MPGLQIPNPRERALVRAADLALSPLGWRRGRPAAGPIRRVLLLRLERIGDLLMVLDAIAEARAAWPNAEIDLAVGSWNVAVARLVPGVTHVHAADVPWLARQGEGDRWPTLLSKARAWRQRDYDLALNFEPDIRSNFLAWLSGAPQRHGYWTGGGAAFLTDAAAYEPTRHVAENAHQLVARAAVATGQTSGGTRNRAQLVLPPESLARADSILSGLSHPIVGVHVSGGRESKQWHLDRFVAVARDLARQRNATIVLTGSEGDRLMVATVAAGLDDVPHRNLAGSVDLVMLAAVLARLDLLVTSDTGPMHLAAAVGTPVVALFGPADPRRYGPLAVKQRVLRVDLPCSPCGQVRLPPKRCRGHVPDCMDGIRSDAVVAAAIDMLDELSRLRQTPHH